MERNIILTIQPTGKKENYSYRLGISLNDSKFIFKTRGKEVSLILQKPHVIKTKTSCGVPDFDSIVTFLPKKKSFDLNHFKINEWIVNKGFHIYPQRNPTKLVFKLNLTNFTLVYSRKL